MLRACPECRCRIAMDTCRHHSQSGSPDCEESDARGTHHDPAAPFTKIPDFTRGHGHQLLARHARLPLWSRNSEFPWATSRMATSAVTPGASVPIFSG